MTLKKNDLIFMQRALTLAQNAANADEIPVGAVVTLDNIVIGEGCNQLIGRNDPTAHAEIIAIRQAAQHLQNYRLVNATLYVTLEPCPMCAYAILHARIARLVYAAADPRTGACGSAIDLFAAHHWNHKIICEQGPLQEECSHVLREFFQERRIKDSIPQ